MGQPKHDNHDHHNSDNVTNRRIHGDTLNSPENHADNNEHKDQSEERHGVPQDDAFALRVPELEHQVALLTHKLGLARGLLYEVKFGMEPHPEELNRVLAETAHDANYRPPR